MIKYNKEQLEAIDKCIDFIRFGNPDSYFLIEGKAGSGKTTVIKEVIKHFKSKKIIAGALSHKAKYVIKESIEKDTNIEISYSSIAGMLNMQLDLETGMFKKDYSNKNFNPFREYNIIIIDEASMVNEEMIELIFKEKNKKAKVIFLGDIGQLPPIRTKSNPYFASWDELDLAKDSPIFNTNNKVRLLTRVRQGEESPILPFADFFWDNTQSKTPVKNPANIKYRKTIINDKGALIFVNETKEIFKNLLKLYDEAIKQNKSNLIKFVTYKNATRTLINQYIHAYFFGNKCNTFQKGELITFTENYGDFENSSEFQIIERYPDFYDKRDNLKLYSIDVIFNNAITQIVLLHPDSYEAHEKVVKNKFAIAYDLKRKLNKLDEDAPTFTKDKADLSKQYKTALEEAWSEKSRFPNIDYAYAISTHRGQGSTYDIVVVHEQDIMNVKPISNKQKSQSIYTALTRAKNISIVVSCERIYDEIDLSNIDLYELNNKIENDKYKEVII